MKIQKILSCWIYFRPWEIFVRRDSKSTFPAGWLKTVVATLAAVANYAAPPGIIYITYHLHRSWFSFSLWDDIKQDLTRHYWERKSPMVVFTMFLVGAVWQRQVEECSLIWSFLYRRWVALEETGHGKDELSLKNKVLRTNASWAPTQRRLPCPAALLDLLRLSVERFALLLAGAFLDLGSGQAYSLPEELALYLGCNRDHQTPAHFVKGSRFIKKTKVPLFSHLFIFCALDYPKKKSKSAHQGFLRKWHFGFR